ncbi:sensor histidine kinase [Clostridium intestinale]|uniref:GHKL domain-containing protein n=1 Tax=Clostridium intestinale DSM 6191 TaxID=1121320 RepID=A0A1M5ZDL0_9CLOT|nr:GHKL domain-containing protein [Clostridium intestinale]SHI22288.1 GHKL domain-containing protein [Clostridium intestinale DSM 6191]
MGNFYWIILYILDFIKLYLIIVKIMGYEHKKNSKIFIGGLIGTILAVTLAKYCGLDTWITYIVGTIDMITMTVYLKNYKNVFLVILIFQIIAVIDALFGGIYALLGGYNIKIILDSYIFSFFANLPSLIFYLVLYGGVKIIKIERLVISKKFIGILLLGVIGVGLYLLPVQALGLMHKNDTMKTFTIIGISLSGIAFIAICVYLIILDKNNKYYKESLIINEKLLEQQKDYYSMLIEKDKDTKRFRHDITNHFYCMKILFEDKKYDELYSYIKDIQGTIDKLGSSLQTGNDIVNIVVGDVLGNKINNDIKLKWRGKLPDKLKVSNMDLCIIFSNIIKNSVEAVEKISENIEKKIEVEIKQLENNIIIKVKNPISEKVNIIDDKLKTSKLDKNNHGFGSLNIKEAVKKYGGNIKYNISKESFLVEIIFSDIIMN